MGRYFYGRTTINNRVQENLLADQFTNRAAIDCALDHAIRDALLLHKQAGNPIATWQGGKVVLVAPEDIPIPPDPDADHPDKEENS